MFQEDAGKAFQRTENGAVQKHRSMLLPVFTDIGGSESSRQIQINLMRATLPVTTDRVAQNEFEFGTVKGAFSLIVGVRKPARFQRFLQRGVGLVPNLIRADTDFGAIGILDDDIVETKIAINAQD